MHEHGLVHRDLHPANIIVDEQDNVHIIDLESACRTTLNCDWDFVTKIKPPDMQHAQLAIRTKKDKAQLMKSVDIYNLGLMAWSIKTGIIPRTSESFIPKVGARTKIDKFIRSATKPSFRNRKLISF